MKRILAFSFFPAFVPPSNGGESRLYNLYYSLSSDHHVTLISSSHVGVEEEKIFHGGNFVERRIPKDKSFVNAWKELNPYSSGGDLSGPCLLENAKVVTPMLKAYLEEYEKADIIIHDSPFTIGYDLFIGVDDKARIYNSYNCESVLYKSLHPDKKSKHLWELIYNAEQKLLDKSDAVLYCSKTDLDNFKKIAPTSKYIPLSTPNGMSPLAVINKKKASDTISSVVFIGSGHPPNVDAAKYIVEELAPRLEKIKFHIIGACLPEGSYQKNVIRHGFVDVNVKAEILRNADLGINPMGMGSGSNVKIFDFFAYGVPILSTEFGMRGINTENLQDSIIAPISEFVETIRLWSNQSEKLKEVGLRGQKFAKDNYSWDLIAGKVSECISNLEKVGPWAGKCIIALNDYNSFSNQGGGGVRTREIYNEISKWRPVTFLCFSDSDEILIEQPRENIVVISIPKSQEHKSEVDSVNMQFHVSANDIIASRHCHLNLLLNAVYKLVRKRARDIIIEHPYMVNVPLSFNDRFIYSSQNNEGQIKEDILKYHPNYQELIKDVQDLEKKSVEFSAAVFAVSTDDAKQFARSSNTAGPLLVVQNGASEPKSTTEQDLAAVSKKIDRNRSAVFVGSSHMPNIDAVKYIVDILAPSCPETQFHIVGSICSVAAPNDATNIIYWGIVSETLKSAIMGKCTIALNTVISGGGSNIKLADYFANGLYVVTTPFGIRGYPEGVRDYISVSELRDFPKEISNALIQCRNEANDNCDKRKEYFKKHLSMGAKAKEIVEYLKGLGKKKKKILFVTYRYTNPVQGGAEAYLEKMIEALDITGDFQIDVVSPKVSRLINKARFAEEYFFELESSVNINLRNVRYARFDLDQNVNVAEKVAEAWRTQQIFEKSVYLQLQQNCHFDGLAWGWANPDLDNVKRSCRWAMLSCGLYVNEEASVSIRCLASVPIVIVIKDDNGNEIMTKEANGQFDLSFTTMRGLIELNTSLQGNMPDDVRPLAFYVSGITINDVDLDLGQPALEKRIKVSDRERFRILDNACETSRSPLGISLTKMRGPFSTGLEDYIEENISKYDLVITHNNIFRPAVVLIEKAKESRVPVISIPHVHLDDDFYHFPDVHKSIIDSDLALISPKVACDFYNEKGGKALYHSPGIDNNEVYSDEDVEAFKQVCGIEKEFVLVLGRKSGAKGYQKVISAVEGIIISNDIHVILIGPDDDNIVIKSQNATYLGRQPRNVVRGALLSCFALVNMSESESFGMVILEAWRAGKPVIVNSECAAFHDIAEDKDNAMMVNSIESLSEAILKLNKDSSLCELLARNGNKRLKDFDWSSVGKDFVKSCNEVINNSIR